jgi:1-acyl-sn-glycerol-3-phosphate acyltransferase
MEAVARSPEEALKPRRLRRRKPLRFSPWLPGEAWGDVMEPRPFGGRFRAIRRMTGAVLWTLIAIPIQAVLLQLSARSARRFARTYHAILCRLIGIKVQVVGTPSASPAVLYVSNHSSWLDILVLGGVLEASFVSKAEIGTWPLIGTVARLGRTVFVSRTRTSTGKEAGDIQQRLQAGDSIILFPEGTSNDGTRVLPFRSSFLSVAQDAKQVQPVSLVYDRLGGLPACRRDRPFFAWYGDMDMARHVWRAAGLGDCTVSIEFHPTVTIDAFGSRKALADHCRTVIAAGLDRALTGRWPDVPEAKHAAPELPARPAEAI